MDPADVAWLHMDRPTNLMVVNTVLWFDVPVDQAPVLQLFGERVLWRFRRFRQRAADPALTLAPWAAPEWVRAGGPREPVAVPGGAERVGAHLGVAEGVGDVLGGDRVPGVRGITDQRPARPVGVRNLFGTPSLTTRARPTVRPVQMDRCLMLSARCPVVRRSFRRQLRRWAVGWQDAGRGWGARGPEWAYLVEPYARPANELMFARLGVGAETRLLDIACGSGFAASLAAARGATVTGLDASERLLAIARARTPAGDFRAGDMFALPFSDAIFDVATSFNGIWKGCEKALEEAYRVLKPAGGSG